MRRWSRPGEPRPETDVWEELRASRRGRGVLFRFEDGDGTDVDRRQGADGASGHDRQMISHTPLFADRAEAGRRLAEILAGRALGDAVVYALPRGGVPAAVEIARRLDAPLDLALVRKIGAPGQPELAVGAVIDGEHPHLVVNEEALRITGATAAYLDREGARELAEIERRRRLYLRGRARPDPRGRTAVVVDDGLATGSTARAAVQAMRMQGVARVVLAVPVAAPEAAARIRQEVDQFVCLAEPEGFRSVGELYDDFHQLDDREVLDLLDRAWARHGSEGGSDV
jgi:putative phosphoribosyl transferase